MIHKQRQIKIGYLTSEYPGVTDVYGGLGVSIRDLAKAMSSIGMRPIVFCLGDFEDEECHVEDILVVKIKKIRLLGAASIFTGLKISKVINNYFYRGLLDVLEAPDWSGITAFVYLKIPLVLRLNGTESYFKHLEGKKSNYRNWFLEKRTFVNSDKVISVSRFTADLTNQIFKCSRQIEVIPNAVDSDFFVPTSTLFEQPTVLYFGTLTRKKGVFELPFIFEKVFSVNPNTKFLIVGRDNPDSITGSNSTWNLLKGQFDKYSGINVQYIPGLPRTELAAYIQQSSVCVFPSYAEALPVSWLEAMSCGKPVVASDIGWAKEIIVDGIDGLLVHPADHQGFADKVNRLLSDTDLCNQIGISARQTILNRFSSQVVLDHYLQFYSKVLGKSIKA